MADEIKLAGTLAAAAAGGALVGGLGAPAGWLSGAMLGVAALAASGRAVALPRGMQRLAIALAGVGMGSGLTPATLHTLARYPASLALLALGIVAMTGASYAVLLRTGFNRATAFYAAVPGALSYVLLTAARGSADLPRVAVIQVFRIFVLMAIVPLVARLGVGAARPQFATDPPWLTVVLVALALALGWVMERRRVPNAALYAAIAVSLVAHGTGLAPGRLTPSLQVLAQALVGAWVGTRFIGFDWGLLRKLLGAAAVSFVTAFAAAAAFSAVAAATAGVGFADALAAFAPGGLEAMTMMAFSLGLDPLYVGSHHIARFLFISATLPWAARRLQAA